ncbi:hypothetical protein LSH36_1027g00082 [Paralvinella palmiformis]|uniref:Uncharacterized protein n=1 Tax=Paralvinella palmiformis TaxID=53620 RepID=A0AAD9IWY6_9ANNE|nr:hypothetical protein LSH36_1027g00082 [Paralvinella palmiformis]
MASEGENDVIQTESRPPENDVLESPPQPDGLISGDDPDDAPRDDSSEDGETPREGVTNETVDELEKDDLKPEANTPPDENVEQVNEEESPPHTPGGTPIAKHVQFEEANATVAVQPPTDIQEEVKIDDRDEPTDPDTTEPSNYIYDEDPEVSDNYVDVQPAAVAPSVGTPTLTGNGTPTAVDHPDHSNEKQTPVERSAKKSGYSHFGSMPKEMKSRWGCCCGTGWFMVGVVALIVGVMLIVYLRQYWKMPNHRNESLLLYFGIGTCAFGVLMLLVGLSFWTYACIMWRPSETDTDTERQAEDKTADSSSKTIHINNMADDQGTLENNYDKLYYVNGNGNDQRNPYIGVVVARYKYNVLTDSAIDLFRRLGSESKSRDISFGDLAICSLTSKAEVRRNVSSNLALNVISAFMAILRMLFGESEVT